MRGLSVFVLSLIGLALGPSALDAQEPVPAGHCLPDCGPVCQPKPCFLKSLFGHCKGGHAAPCQMHHAPAPKVTVVVPPPEVVFKTVQPTAAPVTKTTVPTTPVAAPRPAAVPTVQYTMQPVVQQVVTMQPVVQQVVTMQAVPTLGYVATAGVTPTVAVSPAAAPVPTAALAIKCGDKDVCAEIARLDAAIKAEMTAIIILRDAETFAKAQEELRKLFPPEKK
jgi:hypothetical protein